MARGKFITFEGGEGSGKSTQVRLLADRLKARAIDAVLTREPGGSPFAERLRRVLLDPAVEPHTPLAEALLFYAARADHLDKIIRPALAQGRWVVCDRFSDSTRVYQGQAGAVDLTTIDALDALVVAPTQPDLTFVIDVPVEIGLARALVRRGDGGKGETGGAKGGPSAARDRGAQPLLADRYESRDFLYHNRLREGFLRVAAAEPERCTVINGKQTPEEIAAAVWATVEARLLGVR